MKELNHKQQDKTEIHALKPVNKELKFLGTLRPQKGQKVWQMDLRTRIITVAEYKEESSVNYESAQKGDLSLRHKLVTKEGHIYCCAINAENADKKFFKMLGIKRTKTMKVTPK